MTRAVPAIAEKWIDVAGIRTRYLEAGDGEPVMFIHGGRAGDGALAESAGDWALALAALAPRHRCIAFDRLGQGGTGAPSAEDGYTMGGSVTHAIGFLRAFPGEAFHLVGHGHGGYVAAEAALAMPAQVRSCTFVASELLAPGNGRSEFVLAGNPHPATTMDAARFVLERSIAAAEALTLEWTDRIGAIFAADSYRAAVARMEGEGLYDTVFLPRLRMDRDRLFARLAQAALGPPSMLIWGHADPIAPIGMAYAAYDLLARHELRCALHIVNGAGHYAHRERPGAVHRILGDFFATVRHGA